MRPRVDIFGLTRPPLDARLAVRDPPGAVVSAGDGVAREVLDRLHLCVRQESLVAVLSVRRHGDVVSQSLLRVPALGDVCNHTIGGLLHDGNFRAGERAGYRDHCSRREPPAGIATKAAPDITDQRATRDQSADLRHGHRRLDRPVDAHTTTGPANRMPSLQCLAEQPVHEVIGSKHEREHPLRRPSALLGACPCSRSPAEQGDRDHERPQPARRHDTFPA